MAEAQHERISEKRPPPKKANFDSFFGDAFDSFDSIYQKPSGGQTAAYSMKSDYIGYGFQGLKSRVSTTRGSKLRMMAVPVGKEVDYLAPYPNDEEK